MHPCTYKYVHIYVCAHISSIKPIRCIFYIQVAVDMDFDREMFKLHTKVNKGEIILGWYVHVWP